MGFSNKRTKIKRHNGNRMLVTASKLAGCTYEEEKGWARMRWFMKNPQGHWHGGKPTEIAHAKNFLAGKGEIINDYHNAALRGHSRYYEYKPNINVFNMDEIKKAYETVFGGILIPVKGE